MELDSAIKEVFKQINDMHYDAELKNYQVTKIAIAFLRKDVKIVIKEK